MYLTPRRIQIDTRAIVGKGRFRIGMVRRSDRNRPGRGRGRVATTIGIVIPGRDNDGDTGRDELVDDTVHQMRMGTAETQIDDHFVVRMCQTTLQDVFETGQDCGKRTAVMETVDTDGYEMGKFGDTVVDATNNPGNVGSVAALIETGGMLVVHRVV